MLYLVLALKTEYKHVWLYNSLWKANRFLAGSKHQNQRPVCVRGKIDIWCVWFFLIHLQDNRYQPLTVIAPCASSKSVKLLFMLHHRTSEHQHLKKPSAFPDACLVSPWLTGETVIPPLPPRAKFCFHGFLSSNCLLLNKSSCNLIATGFSKL